MSFRFNHYAAKILDNSGSLDNERIVIKIIMVVMLFGFSYELNSTGFSGGAALFFWSGVLISIALAFNIFSLVVKLIKWLKK